MYKRNRKISIMAAVIAAMLFGASMPLSKLFLNSVQPLPFASLMYMGSGLGAFLFKILFFKSSQSEAKLTKKNFPWLLGVVFAGGVAAPVVLMFSLKTTPASTASLLLNFEAVSTALIAAIFFKEALGRRVWLSVGLITAASVILSWSNTGNWGFSFGALGIIMTCILWGLDNNFTRNISDKNPLVITTIKGFGAGVFSLILSLVFNSSYPDLLTILLSLLMGMITYGIGTVLFMVSLRSLGAARTSAFFGTSPFLGTIFSVLLLGEVLSQQFLISLPIMVAGTILIIGENHSHAHIHEVLEHNHKHRHDDLHHNHAHPDGFTGEHAHLHTHESLEHEHPHTPDIHHRHGHKG